MQDTRQELVNALAAKAESLYRSRQHLCADAILLAFNHALEGGLNEQQVVGLTAGMSVGQGDSGCLCGAVAGGTLVLGLFLSKEGAYRNSSRVRAAVNVLHDRFKLANKSTCCRVLTKKVKNDRTAHFDQCARYTGEAARIVAEILFDKRPELIESVDASFIKHRTPDGVSFLRRAINRLFH